jgi:hypothetical protein
MSTKAARRATLTAVLVVAAMAVPAWSTSSAAQSPPCSKGALEAAMRRGHVKGSIRSNLAFGCEGRFAFAFAATGGPHGFDFNLLFKAGSTRWNVVPRATYCKRSEVPRRIKRLACSSD